MDMTMILGLAIAGSVVMLSGDKKKVEKSTKTAPKGTEFIVRIADGDVAVNPKP